MAKFAQGQFVPKNAQKYVGKHTPRYRSGWELTFMNFCDNNKNVLYWASEAISVPYRNPFTGQPKNYIPDFFVVYENKYGKKVAEVVEIKPKKQTTPPNEKNKKTAAYRNAALTYAKNYAKWSAAREYCEDRQMNFLILTEDHLGV